MWDISTPPYLDIFETFGIQHSNKKVLYLPIRKYSFYKMNRLFIAVYFQVMHVQTPLSELLGYSTIIRTLSSGTATFSMEFSEYRKMPPVDEEKAIMSVRGFWICLYLWMYSIKLQMCFHCFILFFPRGSLVSIQGNPSQFVYHANFHCLLSNLVIYPFFYIQIGIHEQVQSFLVFLSYMRMVFWHFRTNLDFRTQKIFLVWGHFFLLPWCSKNGRYRYLKFGMCLWLRIWFFFP